MCSCAMGSVWQQLGAAAGSCWSSVSTQLPHLQAQLSQQLGSLGDSLPAWLGGLAGGEEVVLGGRRLRVGRQLAEGGYSFVYLAREAPSPDRPAAPGRPYALKKVLAGSREQVEEVRREIEVMGRLRHPNLLPLLASSLEERTLPDGSRRQVALMLFPRARASAAAGAAADAAGLFCDCWCIAWLPAPSRHACPSLSSSHHPRPPHTHTHLSQCASWGACGMWCRRGERHAARCRQQRCCTSSCRSPPRSSTCTRWSRRWRTGALACWVEGGSWHVAWLAGWAREGSAVCARTGRRPLTPPRRLPPLPGMSSRTTSC